MCELWCGMLYLLRLRLYKSLHMFGLQCYAHPADGGKAYGWALGSEFFGEGVEGL